MKSASIFTTGFFLATAALAQHGIDPHWSTLAPVAKFDANASAKGAVANNMVVDQAGRVIIFYSEQAPGANAAKNYYAGSSDNGQTWNAPAPTLFAPATKTVGNSSLSADLDREGNIHVIWSARTPSGLFYARWEARTQTWSDTLRISKTVRYRITFSQITVDRKNRLHAMWMDGETQTRQYSEVMYNRSIDNGQTWSEPLHLSEDDNMHSAFPMSDFSGATSDTLGIAWRDSVGSGNWDIFASSTHDGGATWSVPSLVTGGSGMQSDPNLVVDRNGIFHLAYHEYPQNGGPQSARVFYGTSTNHGLNWTPFTQISESGMRSHLVKTAYDFHNDRVWIFWKDERDFVSPFDRRADLVGMSIMQGGTILGAREFISDGGEIEYGFHNFKVGPEGSVHAHCNTFYNDSSTPAAIYYTRREAAATAVQAPALIPPQHITLHQNYPNPFNPVTEIRFALQQRESVVLKILDTLGREVAVLLNGKVEAGEHAVHFEAGSLPSGVYFVQLQAGRFSETRKAALLK